jgi:undecaprenyl diphosphate synthase
MLALGNTGPTRDLPLPNPEASDLPQHIAIIMDGNRRWAGARGLPKAAGHAVGARRVRAIVQACGERGIGHLTLFAFSTENWRRPLEEVRGLMRLLTLYLQKEIGDLNAQGVRLRVIGDTSKFDSRIQALIRDAVAATAHNRSITLNLALNYGGRWDILQAMQAWQAAHPGVDIAALDEAALEPYLQLADGPAPDLMVRTGGESRMSNFLLWQMAYTELYFTDLLWPEFTPAELDKAIAWYARRDRRFGGESTLRSALDGQASA